MKVNEIAQQINEGVLEPFQRKGFKYLKAQKEFIRKTDKAEQIFRLFYYKENDGSITIKPEIIIKVYEIESIYRSIAQIESMPYSTLGNYLSNLRDFDGDDENYKSKPTKYWLVENIEDANHLVEVIPDNLEDLILPYFDKNSDINCVDKLLNQYPEKISVHSEMYPLRANIAIIAAKLNHNPNYDELVKIYERELEDAEENYKIEFFRLKDLLATENY